MPVSSKPIQEQIFTLFDMNIRLTLYFNSVSKGWQFDLFDADKNKVITQRQGLAVNAPSLLEKNLPFILMLSDKSQFGINSVSRNELGNRLRLYVIDKEVWREAIRTTT
ncbi:MULTISPECIES: phage baseplate plug family protein [unclassified Proteus (in: enterobacteria)]|uniref:phage baseplate plug family protein n=1 Tax=unclassified Proteus (in: enterobacteria) TaxID=257482 RepID=UPI001EEFCAD0|nr:MULTISPECIES: hypothetical protein [unclassified Proteus (in: enterobacteria)]